MFIPPPSEPGHLPLYRALRLGRRLLVFPPLVIILLLLLPAIPLYRAGWYGAIPVVILLALGLGWLWWSYWVSRWRLWAFAGVPDVRALEQRAEREMILHPRGNWMSKTEIWSASQRAAWQRLQVRFDAPPLAIFPEDPRLPASKTIHFSPWDLPFSGLLAAIGLYLIFEGTDDKALFIGCLALAYAVYLGYTTWQKRRKRGKTFLILDATGLYLHGKHFLPWEAVQRYWISREGTGKSAKYFLYLNADRGNEILPLEEANVGHNRLEYLLDVYYGRFRQQEAG